MSRIHASAASLFAIALASTLALTGLPASLASAAPPSSTVLPTRPLTSAVSPDFDGDGKADIATNAQPFLDEWGLQIRYGSGRTVTETPNSLLGDDGAALTSDMLARDLNLDGYTDLAFAVQQQRSNRETVYIAFGSPTGLALNALQAINCPSGMNCESQTFGRALALVESPRLRLAIAGDDADTFAGAVALYDLDDNGVPAGAPTILVPGENGVPQLDGDARFGASLASSGSLLFIGAPGATVDTRVDAGKVVALTLDGSGVASAQSVSQNTAGVAGAAGHSDEFGYSLAARDGYVVIGTPGDTVAVRNTGSVQVFSITGGALVPVKRIAQSTAGIPGKDEKNDFFGGSVAIGTVCPGVPGVIVGAPRESIKKSNVGSVWVIPLEKKAGCRAYQLYQGHGLSGSLSTQRKIGTDVGVISELGATTDKVVIVGSGDLTHRGGLFVWSAATHKTLLYTQLSARGIGA